MASSTSAAATTTASPPSLKILTVGAAFGSLRALFEKIKSIDAKHGKFDFVLCTGDFFGPPGDEPLADVSDLLDGKLEAPLECYVMQAEHALPERVIDKFASSGGELAKNVFLLSKSGLITTPAGLRIACLGGTFDPSIFYSAESAPGFSSPFFSTHTVERLFSNTVATPPAPDAKTDKKRNYTSLASIAAAASNAPAPSPLVDILLSAAPPHSITHLSPSAPPELQGGAPPIDDVVTRTRPRYHFVCGRRFWEREPYTWTDESGTGARVARYVSLSAFGGETPEGTKKPRWFYAFTIAPNAPGTVPPANATMNPFLDRASRPPKRVHGSAPTDESGQNFIFGEVRHGAKRARVDNGEPGKPPPGYRCKRCDGTDHFISDCPERSKPPEGYICKICNTPGHLVRDCPTRHAVGDTGGRKPRPGYVCRACGSDAHLLDDCPQYKAGPPPPKRARGIGNRELAPDECWFCLSNPQLAKHLIVSIGTECYLTLPKGPLVDPEAEAGEGGVPGGGHVLIVPITHYPTYASIPASLAPPILEETARYKSALATLYTKHERVPVFYELGRKGHAHVQSVPVPRTLAAQVERAFREEGKLLGIEFELAESDGDLDLGDGGGYLKVDLPGGGRLLHRMRDGVPVSVNFGRQVLAGLLDTPERADWKDCVRSEEEDRADAGAFKEAFGGAGFVAVE